MSVKWTARALTTTLTLALMTQPGFAATRAKHAAGSKRGAVAAAGAASPRKIDSIEKRGEDVSAAVRLRFEPRVAALAQQVDLEGDANSAALAERLASEFSTRPATLVSEHLSCGGSWGDVMIAHTLRANVRFPITVAQVYALHRDGMGWTMVAHGLGLGVEPFVAAVENESQVAIGQSRPDGKVPAIGPAGAENTSVNSN